MANAEDLLSLLGQKFKPHPWHGVSAGDEAPETVNAFIEIVPSDHIKYEIDKTTGYMAIDRPHKFSNIVPALYGFIPRTYCGDKIADYCMEKSGKTGINGDGDPLDVMVLTEREVPRGDIMVEVKPIGGFRMIDGGEADDKILAVVTSDQFYGKWNDVTDIPESILNRVLHYLLTYKEKPGSTEKEIEITHTYNKAEAYEVIRRSMVDYDTKYGNIDEKLKAALTALV